MKRGKLIVGTALLVALAAPAQAEDLYRGSNWASMSGDRKASQPGDILTVVIVVFGAAAVLVIPYLILLYLLSQRQALE